MELPPKKASSYHTVSQGGYQINMESSLEADDPNKSKEFSEEYDYAMIFKMEDGKQSEPARFVMQRLLKAGLEIFPYLSVQEDELIVLIRCPLDVMETFADNINYKLKANPQVLQAMIKQGNEEKMIKGVEINADERYCKFRPFDHIYLEYRQSLANVGLYDLPNGSGIKSPFTKTIRIKLIYLLLRAPLRAGGCDLQLSRLLHKRKLLAIYPLHEKDKAQRIFEKIKDKWTMPWTVSAHDVKEYFGEKIALYNIFLGHYSLWLIAPSIVGLAFQLVVWGQLDFSNPVLPFYSLLVTVWSIMMLEYWKRQEATTALLWGMSDFEQQEQVRPEFFGESIHSYINGRKMLYFPPDKSRRLAGIAMTIVNIFIAIVIGIVAAIYVFRFYLQSRNDTQDSASTVASILNTVQIQILNMIYSFVAIRLTDYENQRTDTQYEDSLIVKLFIFQFINSFASFFFLAFIAGNLDRPDNVPDSYSGQCGAENCMVPLSINLAIIFGTRLTLGNFLDVFLPYFFGKQRYKNETKGIDEAKKAQLTPAEQDYVLIQYNSTLESISCYADTAIQYGFTLLFITALPCASFFSLVSNYAKVKFTAWKLCKLYQRPVPMGAQDIGTWQSIFTIISVAAVITNAGLVCFTMTVLEDYSLQGRIWIFIGFQWVLICAQFIATVLVPDVPLDVEIQLARTEFYTLKVIEEAYDEDYNAVEEEEEDIAPRTRIFTCCNAKAKAERQLKLEKQALKREPSKSFEKYPEQMAFNYPHNVAEGNWPKPINQGAATQGSQEQANNANTLPEDSNYVTNNNFASRLSALPSAGQSAAPNTNLVNNPYY